MPASITREVTTGLRTDSWSPSASWLVPLTGLLTIIVGALAVLFGLLGVGRARRGAATNKVMSWLGEQFEQNMQELEPGTP